MTNQTDIRYHWCWRWHAAVFGAVAAYYTVFTPLSLRLGQRNTTQNDSQYFYWAQTLNLLGAIPVGVFSPFSIVYSEERPQSSIFSILYFCLNLFVYSIQEFKKWFKNSKTVIYLKIYNIICWLIERKCKFKTALQWQCNFWQQYGKKYD